MIQYDEYGDPRQKTILLLHGAGALDTFCHQYEALGNYHLVVPHLHEMWGAIHSAEIGDGTLECRDLGHTVQMLDLFMQDRQLLADMCHNIMINKSIGIYDGAYNAVKLAMDMKK